MSYTRTTWATGDVITATKLTNIESGVENLHGTGNQVVALIQSLYHQIDTRSWVATTWNTDAKPTHIDIKDGAVVVATLDLTWNTDGKLTQCIAAGGGKTVTYTVSWTGEQFNSISKVVV